MSTLGRKQTFPLMAAMGGKLSKLMQHTPMELLNCYSDMIRLSRARLRESKGSPARALEVLRDEPKSRRYRALYQTLYARLRVLTRHPPDAELSPLRASDWFRSPASETEKYCRLYVIYMLAYIRGDEQEVALRQSEMKSLKVLGLVRGLLIVT